LPEDYQVPQSKSNFYKFVKGENKFRIVSKPVIGYQHWVEEGKTKRCIRSKEVTGAKDEKHFWAFIVYNYEENALQLLELTQKGIMNAIQTIIKKENKGDVFKYDFYVDKKGEKMDTEYVVSNSDNDTKENEVIKEAVDKATILDLSLLFEGGDPFEGVDTGLGLPF
jgi:hypothetical protein